MSNPWTAIKQQATAKKFQLITAAERYLSNQKDSVFERDPWAPKSPMNLEEKAKGMGKVPRNPGRNLNGALMSLRRPHWICPFLTQERTQFIRYPGMHLNKEHLAFVYFRLIRSLNVGSLFSVGIFQLRLQLS